ncbi:hypothetical protein EV128_102351 [Rhizobium azibense]|nr:hypothetical protein EV128_102351 [Rhizobium azibense]
MAGDSLKPKENCLLAVLPDDEYDAVVSQVSFIREALSTVRRSLEMRKRLCFFTNESSGPVRPTALRTAIALFQPPQWQRRPEHHNNVPASRCSAAVKLRKGLVVSAIAAMRVAAWWNSFGTRNGEAGDTATAIAASRRRGFGPPTPHFLFNFVQHRFRRYLLFQFLESLSGLDFDVELLCDG